VFPKRRPFLQLPKVTQVFDHFYVVNLFNERLAEFRRELQREAEGLLAKKVFRCTR